MKRLLPVLLVLLLAACALPGKGNLATRQECAFGRAPASRCAIDPPGPETILIRHE